MIKEPELTNRHIAFLLKGLLEAALAILNNCHHYSAEGREEFTEIIDVVDYYTYLLNKVSKTND